MKSFIRHSLVSLLDKMGYEISLIKKGTSTKPHFFNSPPNLPAFFQLLRDLDFQPTHIMDVGAHKGTWSLEAMEYFPIAQYTMIEPQPVLAADLRKMFSQQKNVEVFCAGAGSSEGTMRFSIHKAEDCRTFLLNEVEAQALGYSQIDLPVITLDSYIRKNPDKPIPDMLKVDAEGLDLDVLEGAGILIGITEIIFIEAGVNNIRFPNSVAAVVGWLDKHGYRLFDITSTNRPFWPYALWTTELVFVKKQGRFNMKDLNEKGGFGIVE